MDLSLAFLRTARRYARRDGVAARLALTRADLRALPYPDASFDLLASGGTPNEWGPPAPVLAELARVARPGARLWLLWVAPAGRPSGRALQALLRAAGLRFPTPAAMTAAAGAAGWEPVREARWGSVALALHRRA